MKPGSTLVLKGIVIFLGLVVLGLCLVGLPIAISSDHAGYYRPILFGMYIPAIPFFFALYQTLKLLTYIDKNKAFSEFSVQALKYIKYCGVIIGALYALGMPYIFHVANTNNAPGVIAIGLVIVFASFVVAVFAAVLQKVLQNAIDIKSENDLTV